MRRSRVLQTARSNSGAYYINRLGAINRFPKAIYRQSSDFRGGRADYLHDLNESQEKAVTFQTHPLQILAGPGTGKTRVLTSRIPHLISNHKYSPSTICALTFTKKASVEMKNRLTSMVGAEGTQNLALGTFHALCAQYLRNYGSLLDPQVPPNFLIWDDDECKLIVKHLSQPYKGLRMEVKKIQVVISRQKETAALGIDMSLEDIAYGSGLEADPKNLQTIINNYKSILEDANALDFTDLLVKGYSLIKRAGFAQVIRRLNHILVDEFQDTNFLQYDLVKALVKSGQGGLTIVGDPDQSIYSWRGAEIENFDRMEKDFGFPKMGKIYLEMNYRSTGSILATAHGIISQAKDRPPKKLVSVHSPDGPKPMLKGFKTSAEEANFIVDEIKRVIAQSGGLFDYGDFAILMRDNYSHFLIKQGLKDAGIPARILSEDEPSSSLDRPEIKDILAYIRLAINTAHTPALIRILEGRWDLKDRDTLILKFLEQGISEERVLFDVLESVCSRASAVPPLSREDLIELKAIITVIKDIARQIRGGESPASLIGYILQQTNYRSFLENKYSNSDWRWKNVQRLAKLADNFSASKDPYIFPVIKFLDWVSSYTDPFRIAIKKVTISTCHSAKGLEWPVVFIPQVVDGAYPHFKSNNVDEERRLLYVACTRAQCLLYFTYPKMELVGKGKDEELPRTISDFIQLTKQTLFQKKPPQLSEEDLELFKRITGRKSTS